MQKPLNESFSPENQRQMFVTFLITVGMLALASSVMAGGTTVTMFDQLATDTDAAVFGPLGQTVIGLGALAGGLFAVLKGTWLLAGLGIAIAALMFGAQLVANSSGFGALI